ncbi:ABC transporter ATP-binding protein [Lacisediminimonas sp.]|uniref:ABC transporter ATP-binding protein n=1 Tax=Lacisediminimonas sp. TaxID=3060582 RepID=UPI00272738F0|nr:ABC transporter ATP-binding protein [Lacisediminimonas sp.]MDO8301079.1 ABC transporter ATP-binding protein [Lacisediminimonas sp.]
MVEQLAPRKKKLRVEHVGFTYVTGAGETPALLGLDFDVFDGEFCSIVGPSGCGKSTLLSILSGLLAPDEGQVLLDQKQINGVNGQVGFVLQKDHLFEWRNVIQNAELGLELAGRGSQKAREKVHQMLDAYGLGPFKHAYPHQLSGGMRQRVALIRTLATEPELLLLDEPFSALDYQTTLLLERDMHEIIRRNNKTALMVTHDIEEAVAMSDRVIVLSNRPARIKRIVDVKLTLTGERTPLTSRDAPEFRGYCKSIWEDLEGEQRAN